MLRFEINLCERPETLLPGVYIPTLLHKSWVKTKLLYQFSVVTFQGCIKPSDLLSLCIRSCMKQWPSADYGTILLESCDSTSAKVLPKARLTHTTPGDWINKHSLSKPGGDIFMTMKLFFRHYQGHIWKISAMIKLYGAIWTSWIWICINRYFCTGFSLPVPPVSSIVPCLCLKTPSKVTNLA